MKFSSVGIGKRDAERRGDVGKQICFLTSVEKTVREGLVEPFLGFPTRKAGEVDHLSRLNVPFGQIAGTKSFRDGVQLGFIGKDAVHGRRHDSFDLTAARHPTEQSVDGDDRKENNEECDPNNVPEDFSPVFVPCKGDQQFFADGGECCSDCDVHLPSTWSFRVRPAVPFADSCDPILPYPEDFA